METGMDNKTKELLGIHKGCGKVTYSHGIPMPICGEYAEGKNFIYLCEDCCEEQDVVHAISEPKVKW